MAGEYYKEIRLVAIEDVERVIGKQERERGGLTIRGWDLR